MECTLSLKTYQLGISSSQHEKNLFFSKNKLVYMNLHHVLTSTRRFRADETFFSFPNGFSNLSNSRFRSLIGWIQAIKLRKREFDRLEKIQHFYQLHLAYRKRLFQPILRGKTLLSISKMKLTKILNLFQSIEFSLSKFDSLDQKKKNAQNQRAKLIFSK